MKILFITQATIGGTLEYFKLLIPRLMQKGFDITVICPTYGPMLTDLEALNITVHPIEMERAITPLKDLTSIKQIIHYIKSNTFDLIHVHSSKAGALGRIASFITKKPCIYTPHCWSFAMRTNRSRQTLYLLIEKILSPLTCNIIAISASEQNQALQHKIISQEKISLILNGIDINKYVKSLENKAIMMNQLGISKGTKVIGMVARIAPQKDVFTFVRAAKRIVDKNNNVFFILVGDGEQRLEFEQEISHLGLSDKFLITGWVDNVQDYINIFHVGVLTSRWEGFGLVLAEYMASEVPVVASNVDGIPEVVEDGKTGVLVEPGDVDGFAAATQQLLVDEDLREKYTTRGLVRVRSKFSIDRVADQHEELYNSIHEKSPK